MSRQAIVDTVRAFAEAAAQALGFDAVEIHGAHGCLIDKIFWHPTSQCTDSSGGKTWPNGRVLR